MGSLGFETRTATDKTRQIRRIRLNNLVHAMPRERLRLTRGTGGAEGSGGRETRERERERERENGLLAGGRSSLAGGRGLE